MNTGWKDKISLFLLTNYILPDKRAHIGLFLKVRGHWEKTNRNFYKTNEHNDSLFIALQ